MIVPSVQSIQTAHLMFFVLLVTPALESLVGGWMFFCEVLVFEPGIVGNPLPGTWSPHQVFFFRFAPENFASLTRDKGFRPHRLELAHSLSNPDRI